MASKQNGYITRDNVVELLGITKSQAYRILKKMADKGKLVLDGDGFVIKVLISYKQIFYWHVNYILKIFFQ